MNAALLTSVRPDWCSPQSIVDAVRRLGAIGLDPCSNAYSIVGATTSWTGIAPSPSGLVERWHGHGLVYVNPPYGREIGKWTSKMVLEADRGSEIIALLPARTDTKWFHRDIATADAVCFLVGRLTFLGGKFSAPFPSMLAYWGTREKRFRDTMSNLGICARW